MIALYNAPLSRQSPLFPLILAGPEGDGGSGSLRAALRVRFYCTRYRKKIQVFFKNFFNFFEKFFFGSFTPRREGNGRKAGTEQRPGQRKAGTKPGPGQRKAGTYPSPGQRKAGTEPGPGQRKAGTELSPGQRKAETELSPGQRKAGTKPRPGQRKAGTEPRPGRDQSKATFNNIYFIQQGNTRQP